MYTCTLRSRLILPYKEADIVYRYKNGENDTIFYVLLEHQSSVDGKMMFRLLIYMMEIWRDYLNENKISLAPEKENDEDKNNEQRKAFSIPAIIPIVLHTGSRKWKAPVEFKQLIKESERFNENILNFKSLLIDTSQIGDDEFLKQKSVISLVMYLDKAKSLEEFLEKYPIVATIFKQLSPREKRMLIKWVEDIFKQRFDDCTARTQIRVTKRPRLVFFVSCKPLYRRAENIPPLQFWLIMTFLQWSHIMKILKLIFFYEKNEGY